MYNTNMIQLNDVSKYYFENKKSITGLSNINLTLPKTGFITVLGESGSGKSTLLNIISLNDVCSKGNYYFDGIDTDTFGERETQNFKSHIVSVIRQELNLIPSFKVKDNLMISSNLIYSSSESKKRIDDVLNRLNIQDLKNKKVENLSGGQKQKVAIARALIPSPRFIIADEPTGSLDSENAKIIADILKSISHSILVVVATHDKDLFSPLSDKVINIKNGKIRNTANNKRENANSEIAPLLKANNSSRIFNPVKKSKLSFRTFLLSFISMFITLFLYSASLSSIKNSNERYHPVYQNFQEERYIVTRLDGKEFSDEDYDYFYKKDGVKTICKYDELLDTQLELSSQTIYDSNSVYALIRPVEALDKVESGVLPMMRDEVVSTSVLNAKNLIIDRHKYYLSLDGENVESVTVSAYITYKEDSVTTSNFYVSSYIFGKLYIQYAMKELRNYISDSEGEYNNFKIVLNDDVGSDYIYSNSKDLFEKRVTFNVENKIGKIISKDNILCKDITSVIPNYNNNNEFVVVLSSQLYSNIINSKTYQMSVFSNKKISSDDTYSVLYPYEYTKTKLLSDSVALGYFYMILTIGLGFGISVVSYLFIKNSFKDELEKLSVFESLGYSGKQIKKYIAYKVLIPIVISYVIIVGLFLFFDYLSTSPSDTVRYIFTGSIPIVQIFLIPFTFLAILFLIIVKKFYAGYQKSYEEKYGRTCD